MKNPNSPANRIKKSLLERWSQEDYPGAEPRFQMILFGKDIVIFILLPLLAVILFKACEGGGSGKKKGNPPPKKNENTSLDASKSQILEFAHAAGTGLRGIGLKRSPGSLIKLKLLNVVETYSAAPVHAQIIDGGLGNNLIGGTLIGDAISDTNFERINITFRFARDPIRDSVAFPIAARALSLDGTLGIIAQKKEGVFTRSAIGSAGSISESLGNNGAETSDLKQFLFKALTAGIIQEFNSGTQVEKNRAQVLTLSPSTEFFAELTDYFPSQGTSR